MHRLARRNEPAAIRHSTFRGKFLVDIHQHLSESPPAWPVCQTRGRHMKRQMDACHPIKDPLVNLLERHLKRIQVNELRASVIHAEGLKQTSDRRRPT